MPDWHIHIGGPVSKRLFLVSMLQLKAVLLFGILWKTQAIMVAAVPLVLMK